MGMTMEGKFGISTKMFMLEELKAKSTLSSNFIITNYKGLNAQELEKLRRELSKSSSKYLVVKNSIVRRAFGQFGLKDLDHLIKDEVGISFVGDITKASKTFVDFAKGYPSLKLNCAILNGRLESIDRIKYLAGLPPKEVLIGLALSYMKGPITNFVGVLSGLLRNFVYVVNAIKDKRGNDGDRSHSQ